LFGSTTKSTRFISKRSQTPSLRRLKSPMPVARPLNTQGKLHLISERGPGCKDEMINMKGPAHGQGSSGFLMDHYDHGDSQIEFDQDQK
jgi:hypothetical protein